MLCFVEFSMLNDAEYAVKKLDGERIAGRSIRVTFARPREHEGKQEFRNNNHGQRNDRGRGQREGYNKESSYRNDRSEKKHTSRESHNGDRNHHEGKSYQYGTPRKQEERGSGNGYRDSRHQGEEDRRSSHRPREPVAPKSQFNSITPSTVNYDY